jgi:hypothetical protein
VAEAAKRATAQVMNDFEIIMIFWICEFLRLDRGALKANEWIRFRVRFRQRKKRERLSSSQKLVSTVDWVF